jgi:hypothetical protein
MSLRPRKYGYKIEGVHRRPMGRVRNPAKAAALRVQTFGAAGKGRQLNADECRAIEARLRQEGTL